MTQIEPKDKPESTKPNVWLRSLYRLGRIVREAASVSLTLAILWLGALGVLMHRPSVDLSVFKTHYEQWFSGAFAGRTADIETYEARWIQERQTIEIRASNIVVAGEDQAEQHISEVRGQFALLPGFIARPVLTGMNIDGGALTIARNEKGVIFVGLGTPDSFERVGALWTQDGQKVQDTGLSNQIDSITLKSAQIYLRDEMLGLNLDFEDVNGAYSFDGELIKLESQGYVSSGVIPAPYKLLITTTPSRDTFAAHIEAKHIRPVEIAPKRGRFAGMANLDAPIDLEIDVKTLPETGIQDLRIDLLAGAGRLKTGTSFKPFKSAFVKAKYNASAQNVDLSKLLIESEALNLDGTGVFSNLGTAQSGFLQKPVDFDLGINSLRINPGHKYDGPIVVKSGQVKGSLDLAARELDVKNLDLDFGSFQTVLNGFVARGDNGKLNALNIGGEILGVMNKQQILGLWANDAALPARNWAQNNILGGEFSDFRIFVTLDENDLKTGKPANDHINISYAVKNGDFKYLRLMPPLRSSDGHALMQGSRYDFHVLNGSIDGLNVEKGHVEIPDLLTSGSDITVSMDLSGTIEEMLRVANYQPFTLSDNMGITPSQFSGAGLVSLKITHPMIPYYDQDRTNYELSGDFTGVTLPVGYKDFKLNDGALKLYSNPRHVSINGPIKVGKWQGQLDWQKTLSKERIPAAYSIKGIVTRDDLDGFGIGLRRHFGGDIALSLSGIGDGVDVDAANISADFTNVDMNIGSLWSKPKGTPGLLTAKMAVGKTGINLDELSLKADGLALAGSLALASDFRLKKLDISTAKIDGFIDAHVKAEPTKDGLLSLSVTGPYLNVETWVKNAFKSQSSSISAPILMTLALEKMSLNENYHLQNATALFSHDGKSVTQARLKGTAKDGAFLAEIKREQGALRRKVRVEIPNASHAALTLMGLDSIKDGNLVIDGSLPLSGAEGGLSGHVEMKDFILVRAPAFTQILSLASLQGMADTLGGSGLKFNKLEMDFALVDGVFKVRDGRASGPALGLTGAGDINVSGKTLDFNGVLVPSYTMNSVLGGIPLLGDVIVGKKGEGMFALNYTVKGPFSKTQVGVNPLSALTPGFLRRIFDVKRDKITDPNVKELIEDQKQ